MAGVCQPDAPIVALLRHDCNNFEADMKQMKQKNRLDTELAFESGNFVGVNPDLLARAGLIVLDDAFAYPSPDGDARNPDFDRNALDGV